MISCRIDSIAEFGITVEASGECGEALLPLRDAKKQDKRINTVFNVPRRLSDEDLGRQIDI